MKDYLLQIKIKNAPLMELMKLCGYANAAELSRASGVPQSMIGQYLNLSQVPWSKVRNSWKKSVLDLAKCLQVIPENMFPAQHINKCLPKNSIEATVDLNDLKALYSGTLEPSIEDRLLEECNINAVANALDKLTDREAKILKMRHGIDCDQAYTLHQIADKFSVTPVRIRQIEDKAIRKLRHPSRSQAFDALRELM